MHLKYKPRPALAHRKHLLPRDRLGRSCWAAPTWDTPNLQLSSLTESGLVCRWQPHPVWMAPPWPSQKQPSLAVSRLARTSSSTGYGREGPDIWVFTNV